MSFIFKFEATYSPNYNGFASVVFKDFFYSEK